MEFRPWGCLLYKGWELLWRKNWFSKVCWCNSSTCSPQLHSLRVAVPKPLWLFPFLFCLQESHKQHLAIFFSPARKHMLSSLDCPFHNMWSALFVPASLFISYLCTLGSPEMQTEAIRGRRIAMSRPDFLACLSVQLSFIWKVVHVVSSATAETD